MPDHIILLLKKLVSRFQIRGKTLFSNGIEMHHDLGKIIIGSFHTVTAAVVKFGCYGCVALVTKPFGDFVNMLGKSKALL